MAQAQPANPEAALTDRWHQRAPTGPDKKCEKWQSLGQVKAGAQAQGMGDLAAFLDLLCKLIEGASHEHITSLVPDDFAPAWQQILTGIQGQE